MIDTHHHNRASGTPPAPPSLSRPTRRGQRTRAIRRALVGHVSVESVHSALNAGSGLVTTTVVPRTRDIGALQHCGERLLAQVPWLDTVSVDHDQLVVVATSRGATA